jgi:CRISPR/Cas system CSM-associated protein Csm3 (group 7 of RAMP superfamily)
MNAEPTYSFAALKNRLTVGGVLVAQTGLRIGAGRDSEVTSNDLPVLRDALGRPFLPGASLKGVLRAQAEGLVRALAPALLDPKFEQYGRLSREINNASKQYKKENQAEKREAAINQIIEQATRETGTLHLTELEERTAAIGQFRQSTEELSDVQYSDLIFRTATLIDLVFGSPQIAGRLFVKDALVDEAYWFGQYEVRNGVGINRDTETAQGGFLYDYEVVPAGTRFEFELMLENAEKWQLGMVWLLLQPWQRGDIQVGGFRTRGLGYVKLAGTNNDSEDPTITYNDMASVDDVLAFLDGSRKPVDATLTASWKKALRDELTKLPAQTGAANA